MFYVNEGSRTLVSTNFVTLDIQTVELEIEPLILI